MDNVILVVTPARNGAEYLDDTMRSVIEQRGDFHIHYHLQDGGSTDATLDIVRRWADRLRDAGGRINGGAPVELSWISEPDMSMYDGIQKGFEALFSMLGPLEGLRVAMTWINTDDIFAAGAFQTVMSYLSLNEEQTWVTGIPSVMVSDGSIANVRDAPFGYCRLELARGRYDGRSRPFFQQEGTFWTEPLWSKVGGLNRRLRFAGDWDLWRRMARHAPVVTLRAVLALHRRHPGQLSEEMVRYYGEVDALAQLDEGQQLGADESGDVALLAACNPETGIWATYGVEMHGAQEMAKPGTNCSLLISVWSFLKRSNRISVSVPVRLAFSRSTFPRWVRLVSGVSGAESWGRWSDANLAPSVRINTVEPLPKNVAVRLRLRVLTPQCNPVTLTIGSHCVEMDVSTEFQEFVFDLDLPANLDTIDMRPAAAFSARELGWSDDSRRLALALDYIEVVGKSTQ